ncbi:DUF4241 domain-containing protein [Streptomyces sp. NBC_00249]|uniref:DUF4241 domain-containing protein n=1 Tax=Streptomyces sp. NBC_00249 TaxID=2975690 RepID=UPI0022545749|nr:DUF4241 domain-containing protein [Streptomyces sp. NBC_00249]MCX5194141.1 DUF4241 domain-containing protein [Streptomyces sp. NBC_00249]
MPMTAPDYSRYFTPGHYFAYESGQTGTLHVAVAGELWLPSGRITACDPFIGLGAGEAEPFTVAVAPGRYRVETAIATLVTPGEPAEDTPHLRTAAARLVISDTETVTWEQALVAGQDPAELGDDEYFGYGVDAGAGCFYDAAADESFPECEGDEGPLWDAFEENGHGPGPYLVSGEEGHNLAAFTSGWGDGSYPTWVGRDRTGAVTCFLTDFFVVPTPQDGAA